MPVPEQTIKEFVVVVEDLFKSYTSGTPFCYQDYDPRSIDLVNKFLIRNNVIKADGAGLQMAPSLPLPEELLALSRQFFNENPDFLFSYAILRAKRIFESPQPATTRFSSQNGPSNLSSQKPTDIQQPQSCSPSFRTQLSLTFFNNDVNKKRQISRKEWEPELFADSVRKILEYYRREKFSAYDAKAVFHVADLQRFTTENRQTAIFKILPFFNDFLKTYGYITQSDRYLRSIKVVKELPTDSEICKLFESFRSNKTTAAAKHRKTSPK